ncbi:MAG: hypothetical protein ACI9CF_001163 [Candidatus Omnitrophota bacterium]|jgi:hypothetical protein
MGGKRNDQIAETFISIAEASSILEMPEEEVKALIQIHDLSAFQLGSNLLRLRKDQVWEYKSKTRIKAELFPVDRQQHQNAPAGSGSSFLEAIRDFVYFNDFYFISAFVVLALLYLIVSSA